MSLSCWVRTSVLHSSHRHWQSHLRHLSPDICQSNPRNSDKRPSCCTSDAVHTHTHTHTHTAGARNVFKVVLSTQMYRQSWFSKSISNCFYTGHFHVFLTTSRLFIHTTDVCATNSCSYTVFRAPATCAQFRLPSLAKIIDSYYIDCYPPNFTVL